MRIPKTIYAVLTILAISMGGAAAHADLKAFSSSPALLNGVPVGGIPSWFQDQNGVAVQPCLDVGGCGLAAAAEPGIFDPSLPIAFPANFPSEAFYFDSVSNNFAVGSADVFVLNALEFTFVNPITGALTVPQTPGALGVPFMRLRLSVKPPLGGSVAAGIWTIQHPWGTATFDTNVDCRTLTAACRMTRDLPLPGALPPNFAAALGAAVPDSISTFLKTVVPAPPAGFLGNAVAAVSVTGGSVRNSVTVTDPLGNTGTASAFQLITGQLFGMEVAPLSHDFGPFVVAPPAATAPVTVTVTNINTVSSLTLGALAVTGPNAADVAIAADGCSNVTIPAGAPAPAPPSTCTFTVAFAPNPLAPAPESAARTATITIPGTFAPVPPATVGEPAPPGIFTLKGTAQYTVTPLAEVNGFISLLPADTPVTGPVPVNAGATQAFNITPNPRFQVRDITITPPGGVAQLQTFVKPANPAQAVSFTVPAVTASGTVLGASFMPSGNITGTGTLGVADALAALRILVGLKIPTAEELLAMDVAPLGADGRPAPDGKQDLTDVLGILRRVVGLITW